VALSALVPKSFDLSEQRFGVPQRSGALTMLPVFGPDHAGAFAPPLSGLKLEGVRGYGSVVLGNPGLRGVAIVPLHIGYIQDQAQNHALCRSLFLAPGQKLQVDDACCVQQAQGGYLEAREQWFFVLPLLLRAEALRLRGEKNYGKLWSAIAGLNARFGLVDRGHLEQIICGKRALLTQYQSRFELLPGQTGALFFLRDRLVGVEITPNPDYLRELWAPLVCFCYGAAALFDEQIQPRALAEPPPFTARSLPELRAQLGEQRQKLARQVSEMLAAVPHEKPERREEERFLDLRMYTVEGGTFAGQYAEDDGRLVYASLAATPSWMGA
jgi:hypothetical protein